MPFDQTSDILLTCPRGLVPYLAAETEALGFPVDAELIAGVRTHGTLADCMRLNLWLRIAHRVQWSLGRFSAKHPDELYKRVRKIEWEAFIPEDGYVSVDSSVTNEFIRDTRFANLRCKDAIVDRIALNCGRRPDSGPRMRGAAVFLFWQGREAEVYLNTSGEPLQRRGYRKVPHVAPLQETLAAGIVAAMGQTPGSKGHMVNPMCGSGTLAIEAALARMDRAPGLHRENFSFTTLRGFDRDVWEGLRESAGKRALGGVRGRIIATDRDPRAMEAARMNAERAGVERAIEFSVCDFRKTEVPEGDGDVVLNPEYGERLGEQDDLGEVYAAIGDFFKQSCQGYTGYVFTGNPSLGKRVGLRTSAKTPFFNSKIECRLLRYELYKGTHRRTQDGAPETMDDAQTGKQD